ncbi:MAG: hypothetical protein K2F57_02930, partial [Candidatus Gastranaerophilales bacterium]|nr:hypothetical protein [Candidatus Gastranaerophilales bacterium]
MYDNIRFWIDRMDIGEEVYKSLPYHLTNAKDSVDRETGETKTTGHLANLRVMVNESGMSVQGSLSRFYYWEEDNGKRGNLYPLDRHGTQKAIEMLSQKFGGVPMQKAKVRALEFGDWMPVSFPVAEYLKCCGGYPRLVRSQFNSETLYYKHRGKNQPKILCLYDKKADARAKGYELPQGFEDCNLLKYELRLKGSIGKQLKCEEVTGETLYDRGFYKRISQTYLQEFLKIKKLPQPNSRITESIKSVGNAVDALFSRLIRQSGIEVIDLYIEELKSQQTYTDRANYSRVRNKLNAIANMTSTEEDTLISEMENGIVNRCLYV